ncbi:tetratricopeptide repeat protein [Clostridium sp. UBA1652]|uniref:tetratricopeptide repeat protein n=1 Tax=Clostridium sp. UBA1652 TaxID=1946348 RepID=UPI00257E79FB|nr:tetratricopeptide repeat protein [Clostridium sp. UBA1652]
MGIKEFFENMTDRLKVSAQVKNKESNNVVDSPYSNIQGNNFGIETVHGDKITQFNTFNVVANNEIVGQEIGSVDLEVDIKRIKEMPNYSYSLKAIEEYNKLLIVHYPKHISNDDYIKILINICYIYINRNELDSVNEFIVKLDEVCSDLNKDVIKVKSLILFNSQKYELALDMMNKLEWTIEEEFEYVLYNSLKCLNNLTTYKEFKDIVLVKELIEKNTYHLVAIVARSLNEYEDMHIYSNKAFDNNKDMHSKFQYAHSLYDYAIKNSIDENKVLHDKINYKYLVDTKLLCEEVLSLSHQERDMKLYKDCMILYVNTLSLLGKINEAMESLKSIKFVEDNDELLNFEERLKVLSGQQDDGNNILSESDIFLKDILKLWEEQKYSETILKIESVCWSKYRSYINIHCILLECYIENKDYSNFINHLRRLDIIEVESNLLIKVQVKYYISKGDYEKAENYLWQSIEKYKDPDSYCWLLSLYDEQGEVEKFQKLIERILSEDKFVLELEYIRIYSYYFRFLFKNNLYYKALEVLNNFCNKDRFGNEQYIKASINIFSSLGRYFDSALELEKLYTINNNYETLFNAANEYFRCNELDKSLDILNILEKSEVKFLERVYIMKSNIYILKNNLNGAYEYAEKAKELVIDIPRSEVHNFFVGRSLRCNKIDNGVVHINEFRESYPKVDDWFKCVKSIEIDEDGNEELSEEIKSFLKEHSRGFNALLEMLREGQVGLSLISKYKGYTINELIRWKDIYNIKVNINSGNIDEMSNEINSISETIVLDAFTLYILSDINSLELLREFNDIRICNSTIEYLNYVLLKQEDDKVREILTFIKNEINIRVIPFNNHCINDFETEFRRGIDDFILDSILYARDNRFSYCYGEVFIKQICNGIGTNSISLVSLIRKLGEIKGFKAISKLINGNFTFINFTYKDMYYLARESNFTKNNNLDNFFKISKGGDIPTFIGQYIMFILSLYYLNRDSFDLYFEIYIKAMESLYRKSNYYLFINTDIANEIYGSWKSVDKDLYLIGNDQYMKGKIMKLSAEMAINTIFSHFENEEEFKYYYELSINIADNKLIYSALTNKDLRGLINKDKIKEIIKDL